MKILSSQQLVRLVCITLLFLISVGSMVRVRSAWAATEISVTVDSDSTIGANALSLGFMLHFEWRYWRDSSARRQLAEDVGFKMVRFFSDKVEPCTYWDDASKTGTFNWYNVDLLVQRIFEVGAEPLIALGFCDSSGLILPPGMAINPSTGLPYPESFAAYCREWVKHFKTVGLPVKYYEIINEAWYYFYPNWRWNEAKAGHFLQLFNTGYNAMHNENPQILIGNDASLFKKFLDYWITHGGKLDLLTFHKYDSWGFSYSDEQGLDSAERKHFDPSYNSLHLTVSEARQIWGEPLPAIITESNWGASWRDGTDPRIQQLCGTVWTALMLRGCILNGVDYWCYYTFSSSKTHAENNLPQGYGFGMINHDDNQPWYPYYVQKMVGNNLAVGDQIVASTTSSSDIRSLAWIHGTKLNILVICKVDQPRDVRLRGLQGVMDYYKIDNTVSWENPRIQTGSIDSTTSFSLRGYTVILLQKEISTSPPTFADGFESGDFSAWTGTITTRGEDAATVVDAMSQHGSYSAMFTSNGGGGWEYAYCYQSISPQSELYARGYFMVTSLGITDNDDRFYFIRFRADGDGLAYAGWRQNGSVVRWSLIIRDGTGWVSAYSDSIPSLNQRYCVELHWVESSTGGSAELWVEGELVCSVEGVNTATFGSVDLVLFGLAELYNCGATRIYCDSCKISKTYSGPFPPWDLNRDGKVNVLDIGVVARAYGSTPESTNWDPRADLNLDNKVNLLDLGIVAVHYGEEYT